ncbi:MAG: MarR family winged helix-turn-helix transcriptional regulator [Candidatus Omnitrophica bacterium]|nr:MarR family winged helix-turn-helix transcriptional regulator [Candidatus Omnitrophota bacterium]
MLKTDGVNIDAMAKELAVAMPRLARKISFDFFKSINIPHAQIFTMLILCEKDLCRISDIRQELDIRASTASGIIDRLVKSGHVKRLVDKNDRRVVNISLTAKGERVLTKLKEVIEFKWINILSKLSNEDRMNYLNIIRKIQRIIS